MDLSRPYSFRVNFLNLWLFLWTILFCLGGWPKAWCVSPEEVAPNTIKEYTAQQLGAAEKAFPNDPEVYFIKGYALHRCMKYEEAIDAFKKGLELKPNQADIAQMIAFIFAYIAKYEEAVEWYKKTAAIDPAAERANERLGLALVKLNRMDEAAKAFEAEIRYHPEDASSHFYLAERYFEAGRVKEASAQAELAMKYDPVVPEPYYLMAKILRKDGNAKGADAALKTFQEKKKEEEKIVEQTPKTDDVKQTKLSAAQLHIELGAIYYRQKRDQEAEAHFLKALYFDPKSEAARYNLATLYQETRQTPKAESFYPELMAMNDKNPR